MGHDELMRAGLFDDHDVARLREALAGYTVDAVHQHIGLLGQAALGRGDLAGLARHLSGGSVLDTLGRLFLAGLPVPEEAARAALHPLPIGRAVAAGLLAHREGAVRALLDVRPYAQQGAGAGPDVA